MKRLGLAALALLAACRSEKRSEEHPPTGRREKEKREEPAALTVDLELGEGDSREVMVNLEPEDAGAAVELPAGTRIEKLARQGEAPR